MRRNDWPANYAKRHELEEGKKEDCPRNAQKGTKSFKSLGH
jgi:hypothetical protein